MMGFAVQFYERAGLDQENTFNFNLGQYAMGAVGTIASWFLMPHFGRRTLYLWGLGFLFCMLMIIGGMGVLGTARGPSLAAGTLLMIYTFVYDFTIGPVCYALVADIPSTRLKIKTVVLARNLYNVGGIINNVLMPRMLLNTEWNWGAKTGFFWAGACLLLFVYVSTTIRHIRCFAIHVLTCAPALLQIARAKGSHVRRTGCSLREPRQCTEVPRHQSRPVCWPLYRVQPGC